MRTFNVSFLVVLSCVAMIGATSIGNRADHFLDTLPEVADSVQSPEPVAERLREIMGYFALQQLMEDHWRF